MTIITRRRSLFSLAGFLGAGMVSATAPAATPRKADPNPAEMHRLYDDRFDGYEPGKIAPAYRAYMEAFPDRARRELAALARINGGMKQ